MCLLCCLFVIGTENHVLKLIFECTSHIHGLFTFFYSGEFIMPLSKFFVECIFNTLMGRMGMDLYFFSNISEFVMKQNCYQSH